MKKLAILLLFLPLVSSAQKDLLDWFSEKYARRPFFFDHDSSMKRIHLPAFGRTDIYKFFEIGKQSGYMYAVREDSTFNKIFSRFDRDTLPDIDFSTQELLLYIGCSQCAVFCGHAGTGKNQPCHRNACRYSGSWFVRKKSVT